VAVNDGDCTENILFLNDSSFLEVENCEDGSIYSMGKYRANDRSLSLVFDSVYVNSFLEDTEDPANANYARTVYHVSIDKPRTRTYQIKEFKGVNLFINKDIGAA
jgi:hypothetical protein